MNKDQNQKETSTPDEDHEKSDRPTNFIDEIIRQDLQSNRTGGRVQTRFPPEPNGYLHIGHAKSISLNFELAAKYRGLCNLRFDDTNPDAENVQYVQSIMEDIRWLGFDWSDRLHYASDYFEQLYQWAVELITKGLAYVDSLNEEKIRQYRGNYYTAATKSPDRDRPMEENLDLFARMRAGEFADGELVLRAKIDLDSPNMNLRDPIMYRIRHANHHRTGDQWCIYPMYDFTHGQSDAIEKITHSICTLEFADHRPLYEWYLNALGLKDQPRQYEFARLNLTYTVMSKRKLLELVERKLVDGWDDPRMPTISGLRRRGYTPQSIRNFCNRIGIAKNDSTVDLALLEHYIREDLETGARRVMGVLDPLKIVIENFPEGHVEELDCPYLHEDFSIGSRTVPLTREIYIERDDFLEEPFKKWFRLAPGCEVRLRYACLIRCTEVIKDPETGEITQLRCTWDPDSKGGVSPDGRKVRGTLHWVSADRAVDAQVRLYDRLFNQPNPLATEEGADFTDSLNPDSLKVLNGCKLEPSLAQAGPGDIFQFERLGYFCVDQDSLVDNLVFNRTVPLRDSWSKIAEQEKAAEQAAQAKSKKSGKK